MQVQDWLRLNPPQCIEQRCGERVLCGVRRSAGESMLDPEHPSELRAGLHEGPGHRRGRICRMSRESDVSLPCRRQIIFSLLCSGASIGMFNPSPSIQSPGIRTGRHPEWSPIRESHRGAALQRVLSTVNSRSSLDSFMVRRR